MIFLMDRQVTWIRSNGMFIAESHWRLGIYGQPVVTHCRLEQREPRLRFSRDLAARNQLLQRKDQHAVLTCLSLKPCRTFCSRSHMGPGLVLGPPPGPGKRSAWCTSLTSMISVRSQRRSTARANRLDLCAATGRRSVRFKEHRAE